ncbi:glycoside hydrolase [Elizabethkingia meningoseptica]|uniref:glycoside hydrolase n=1 Tax=Elizabethkingia meningoseptica TaxID=238 RepID=UPI002DD625A7|nr:glycoside hydrolase [Elizabethkingia meningoseptica]MEC4711103.1 glycoside hydrolase [Elizabethkingia meningoseptica]
MKKKILTTVLLFSCFIICMAAVIANLNGKWSGVINTPDGNSIDAVYNFNVDGEKLTGVVSSPMGEIALENGKVKDNDFSFSVNVSGTNYPHTGKAYTDSCTVDIDFGGGQTSHVVLKRAK